MFDVAQHSVLNDGAKDDMIDYSKIVKRKSQGSLRGKAKETSPSKPKGKGRAKSSSPSSDSDGASPPPKLKKRASSVSSGKSGRSDRSAKGTKAAAVLAPPLAQSDSDTEAEKGDRTPRKARSRSNSVKAAATPSTPRPRSTHSSKTSPRKPSTSSEESSDDEDDRASRRTATKRSSRQGASASSGTEGRGERPPKRASKVEKAAGGGLLAGATAKLMGGKKSDANGATSDSVLSDSDAISASSIKTGGAASINTRATSVSGVDTELNSSAGESSDDERKGGRYGPPQNKATRPKSVRSRASRSSLKSTGSGKSNRSRSSSKAPSVKKHADSDEERAALKTNGVAGPIKRTAAKTVSSYDRHYILKALTYLQMQREWSALGQIGELAMFGEPFLPHPTGPLSKPGGSKSSGLFSFGKKKDASSADDAPDWEKPLEPIILQYEFYRFILQFPGLNEAPVSFWQERIQPFFDSFAERNFSTTRERAEITKRRLFSLALTRILGTYTSTCVTALGQSDPLRPDTIMMKRIDSLFPGTQENMFRLLYGKKARERSGNTAGYASWVAIVQNVEGRGGDEDYTILTTVLAQKGRPLFCVVRSWGAFNAFADKLAKLSHRHGDLGLPALPPETKAGSPPDRVTLQRFLRLVVLGLSNPSPRLKDQTGLSRARIQLERFLLDKPDRLGDRKKRDLLRIAEKDDAELERERRLWVKAGAKVRQLRTTWCQYRDALIAGDELQQSFLLLKKHEKVESLPPHHRDAVRWAAMWVAYNLHFIFVSSPNAAEITNLLKSFHELVPYGLFKTALRIVNPTFMIKAVVNIVLGQPMGSQSLFARVFSIIMNRDIKARQKDVDRLRADLGDDSLADKLKDHVYSPRGKQEDVRRASYDNSEDMIVAILVEAGVPEKRVREIEKGRAEYLATGGTVDLTTRVSRQAGKGALDYYLLKQILRAYCLKRDREQVLEIALEPNTPTLLKSIISVYYNGIYRIAQASNLADRLGDLQRFFDDVIATAESDDRGTAAWIRLTERHQQSLWMLLHEIHAYGGDLMNPMIRWSRSGLEWIRKGVPASNKASGGKGRRLGVDIDALMNDVKDDTRDQILHEARGLASNTRLKKVYNDIWMRCDSLRNSHNIRLNPNDIFAQIAVDPDISAYRNRFGRTDRVRPEDAIAWAWWAEEDILDDVNEVGADWKKEADRADRLAQETHTSKQRGAPTTPRRKKMSRTKSNTSLRSFDASAAVSDTLIPPPPRLLATKTLLEPFCRRIISSLKAARENEVM